MVIFEDNVKQLCKRICRELGQGEIHWGDHQGMVQDWLITEAFNKIRNQYWDEQNRTMKPFVSVIGEEGNKM